MKNKRLCHFQIQHIFFLQRSGALKVNNCLPNLVNLTVDPQLSEMLLYVLKEGMTTVGRQGGGASSQSHDIELKGALVMANHW